MGSRIETALSFFGNSLASAIILIAVCYLIYKCTESDDDKTSLPVYIIRILLTVSCTYALSLFFHPAQIYMGISLVVLFFLLRYYSIPIGISRIKEKLLFKRLARLRKQNSFEKLEAKAEMFNKDKEYSNKITFLDHIRYSIKCKNKKESAKIVYTILCKIKDSEYILKEPSPQNEYLYSFQNGEYHYSLLVWIKQIHYSEASSIIGKIIKETPQVYDFYDSLK